MEELAARLGAALDEIDRAAARQAMESRLVESEARYRSIVERAADGVVVWSDDRRVLDANPAFCLMFGYSREELVLMGLDDLIAPDKRDGYREEIGHFHELPPGATLNVERVGLTKSGQRLRLEIHVKKITEGRSLSVVRDVTERKRLEAERAATERLVSLGRLAQSVGHEINNPLSYLTLRLEHARSLTLQLPGDVRRELDEPLALAADGAARIAHVVRSLSAFGRGDSEVLEPVAVDSVVGAALSLVKNQLHHVAEVTLELAETPMMRANAFGLTQVLVNLLLNAADAMVSSERERHVVTIASRLDGQRVILEVADTGSGIPAGDMARLFDVGFTTKAVGKGNGVGLSVSRSIIASLGGTIEAENRAGGGAVFRIGLSATEEAPVSRPAPARPRAPHRRRVLIVDDEPNLARTLALLLSSHGVAISSTIAEAFDLCAREDFDFVICDLMMPNGGGMELYERFARECPERCERCVFMTGGTFTEAATRFLEEIPNRRLIKPFPPEELLAIVEGPA
jgi:PAS domain S-box-containing protein